MKRSCGCVLFLLVLGPLVLTSGLLSAQAAPVPYGFNWQVVVNNGVVVPGDTRKFNSYNQPSLNVNRLVVFRARSKGGTTGEPAHGIFLRDMNSNPPGGLVTLFDRNTPVPHPNNLSATFIEPPAFPRIDMWSNTVATRGGHQPSWEYTVGIDPLTGLPLTSRTGTSGIYTDPFGDLILGASTIFEANALYGVEFDFFKVPDLATPTKFDVFPGAPAITDRATLVFKGNYTVPDPVDPTKTISKTGVYYRDLTNAPIGAELQPAGGTSPVVLIANSDTTIPVPNGKSTVKFGSTAPPSAVGRVAVFAGFDNEEAPTLGGIYKAVLNGSSPKLKTLVKIGDAVPGEGAGAVFNKLSEGLSFDGRFVAFWGAWGTETKELVLQCPSDGNKNRVAYCKELYGDGVTAGVVSQGFHAFVPVHQGFFVYDTGTGVTRVVAKSPGDFADFVYWNFSGKVPPPTGGSGGDGGDGDGTALVGGSGDSGGSGEGGGMEGGEEDGEPARWRSAQFVAVSGLVDGSLTNATFDVAFKARTGAVAAEGNYVNPTDGIYLRKGPGDLQPIVSVVTTGADGTVFDPAATYIPVDVEGNPIPGATPLPLPVTAMGIERDGFRGNALSLTISMANEVAGWAGIYLTTIPTTF